MFQGMNYVYEVYKEKSFSKAAKNLYISQPSLSANVRRVEAKIGYPIFNRNTSPLTLTECGERYIQSVEEILAIENSFASFVNDLGGHKFFQHDLRDTVTKMQIIQGAQTYRGSMAIALTDRPVGRAIAGQAADEMLNIAGIEASFVLFPEAGQAYLSARSGSNVNVQVISEMLGGGGNATTAGAQFPGKTTEDVLPLLKETIDNYFDDEA